MSGAALWKAFTFPARAVALLAYALWILPAIAREEEQNEAARADERGGAPWSK